MLGKVIENEYKIRDTLGQGAFGVVYLADEINLGRKVALKMLNRSTTDEKNLKKFVAEGRHLASLNHPNVVQIYRLGSYAQNPYIVMEFLEGKPLREVLTGPRLPFKKSLEIVMQIASGLMAIHEMGIVHRDLSTNNIMLTESGKVKILDLGLAKDMNKLSTMESFLAGTIAYISPEQIEGRGTDFSSDIFSLGVIAYELLTGRNPFDAEHYMSILYNIANRQPEPLETYLENPPAALSKIVFDCLEKRAVDRPQDLAEIKRIFARVLDSAEIESTSPRKVRDTDEILGPRATPRNPYLNRVMIKRREDFFGRKNEIKRIYARMNATPPGSVSIVGERKIGKSSLLNHIYMRRVRESYLDQPEKMVMVFLDLQQQTGMSLDGFVKVLIGIADYELRGRLEISDCTHDLDGIKDLVQRLDGAGYRLCFLLDEFEAITNNPNFDLEFFSFLRFLANHYNVSYITSSARDLQVLCHTKEISDSPFFNIFSTMRLGTFREEEARDLIAIPSEKVEKPLEPYAEKILDMAGFFPFFLQIACSHTIEYLDEHENAPPDFDEIRRRFYEEAKLHYNYLWTSFDKHEQSALLRVAKGKSVPDALKHVLTELGRRSYVVPDDGRVRLFAPTFRDFIEEEKSRQSEGGLLKKLFGRPKA